MYTCFPASENHAFCLHILQFTILKVVSACVKYEFIDNFYVLITKLQITGKLHYHRKCDFQLSKRKLGYRTLLPLTVPISSTSDTPTLLELAIWKERCGLFVGANIMSAIVWEK